MKKSLKILISPLNWGLGHASRIIPVINALLDMGHDVQIGGSGDSIDFLKDYYPTSMFIHIDSPSIQYGKHNAIGPGFARSLIGFLKSIWRDHNALKKVCKTHSFDLVISDNRPGLYSKKIKSLYITHQINVKTRKPHSFSGRLVKSFHKRFVDKFDHCLIPDNWGENSLAGELSYMEPSTKCHHIGALSRFDSFEDAAPLKENSITFDVLVMISGPEPLRTKFENKILNKFQSQNKNIVVVRGLVSDNEDLSEHYNNIRFYNNPSDQVMYSLIKNSNVIICRSGYSTLMDLAICCRKSILVPTPGQPEQEYLAERFSEKFGFAVVEQEKIGNYDFSNLQPCDNWDYPFERKKLKKILTLCLD